MGRAMKFTIHTPRADGTMAPKEINGPGDFETWARSWRVFAFAMTALGEASRTRLGRYYDRIKQLVEEFPKYWWVIGMADIRMRSEHLERIRRECVRKHADGKLPEYDDTKPWDIVFREAALKEEYWAREVDKKVLLHSLNMANTAKLSDEGYGTLEEAPNPVTGSRGSGGKKRRDPSSDSETSRPRKKAIKKNTRRFKPVAETPKGPGKGQKKGGGKGSGKHETAQGHTMQHDGRYFKISGTEVCFAWNRSPDGCSDICPHARAHACEKCAGPHRSIGCKVKPVPKGQ
jgi:hypothetical protein